MGAEISWVFEAVIRPDGLDQYGALAREISADNQAAEPGQQIFEWFADGHDVHIYERYQDSAAALAHVQRFVEHFAATREWEWRQWLDGVTDWERKRYFEII